MKLRKLIPLLVLSTSITACAAGGKRIQIEDNVRHSIKTVAIDSKVDIRSSMDVTSATQNVSENFGLIGGLIGDNDKKNKKAELNAAMNKQGVDLSKIVYAKFAREMAKRTPYKPLKENSASDATMSIDVHLHGLQAAGAGKNLYPTMSVTAEMKNPAGKVVWRNHANIGMLQKQNKAKYTYDQLISNPARLEEIFNSVAALAASKAMAEL